MRAYQIMTRNAITVLPEMPILEAANKMLHPTADDEHMRDRIIRTQEATDWRPTGLQVAVRNDIVHLHGIIINDDSMRRTSIVAAENTAGVEEVHDHLCFVDTWSGFFMQSPEDMKTAS
jgi:hypothetical protein